ncbi:MAG: zf-HC2 domain-containing protein [Planctomycetes bacterium]|nr:zf-HC2 domain-containing protein [Planctomycetota bacterium]
MNCERFEALLADALGNELDPKDRALFDAHLESCDKCREEFDSARKVIGLIERLPAPSTSSFVAAPRAPRSPWRSFLRVAAVMLVSFILGYLARGEREPASVAIPGLPGVGDATVESAIVSAMREHPERPLLTNTLSAIIGNSTAKPSPSD